MMDIVLLKYQANQTSSQLLPLLWTSKPCHCHLTVILWCNLLLLSLLEKLLKCQMSPSLIHQPQLLLLLWTSKPCHCHLTVILWCNLLLLSLLEKLLKCQMSPSLRHHPHATMDQQASPRSSCSNPLVQHTPTRIGSRRKLQN